MIIWSATTYDHRFLDAADEGASPEIFGSSRRAVLDAMRELVRETLAPREDTGDEQYPTEQVEDGPVEIKVTRYELADLPTRALVIAALNRKGWAKNITSEPLVISKTGRVSQMTRTRSL